MTEVIDRTAVEDAVPRAESPADAGFPGSRKVYPTPRTVWIRWGSIWSTFLRRYEM